MGLGNTQRMRSRRSRSTAIIELLERTFGADAARTRAFAERLHRWTGGNPFFIDETIKALVERGQLREVGGRLDRLGRRRAARAGDDSRCGARASRRAVGRCAPSRPTSRRCSARAPRTTSCGGQRSRSRYTDRGDRRVARRATFSPSERTPGDIVYDFSHPLLQETLYSELGLARTRTLHGTIAEVARAAVRRIARWRMPASWRFTTRAATRGGSPPRRCEYLARRRARRVGEVREP